jgi:hypothetical protein
MTEREIFLAYCSNCGTVVATETRIVNKAYNKLCTICHSFETFYPVAIDFMHRRFITISPAKRSGAEAEGREETSGKDTPESRR